MNAVNWTAWLVLAMLYCSLTYNPLYQLALLLCLCAGALVKGLPLKTYLRVGAMVSVLPFFVNTSMVHYGSTHLAHIPRNVSLLGVEVPTLFFAGPITAESVLMGAIMAVFITNMLTAFQFFSSMASQDSILRLIPKSMPSTALAASIALRFVPTVVEDYGRISDAQASRGVKLNTGGASERVRNSLKVLSPTVLTGLERGFSIAESMASRGYTPERTPYRKDEWNLRQYLILAALSACAASAAALKYAGILDYWPYDGLGMPKFNIVGLLPLAALLTAAVLEDESDRR
jgi:energy-coupling factor transporter transmembrane protein EcfT